MVPCLRLSPVVSLIYDEDRIVLIDILKLSRELIVHILEVTEILAAIGLLEFYPDTFCTFRAFYSSGTFLYAQDIIGKKHEAAVIDAGIGRHLHQTVALMTIVPPPVVSLMLRIDSE